MKTTPREKMVLEFTKNNPLWAGEVAELLGFTKHSQIDHVSTILRNMTLRGLLRASRETSPPRRMMYAPTNLGLVALATGEYKLPPPRLPR